MKKKLFTLLTLALAVCSGAWADTAVLSWYMGTNGAVASSANSITGASGCDAEGFTIAITGNTGKNWSNGNGDITYNSKTYKTLKNSNGAQNTITCPSGKVATQVVFYAVTNHDDTKGKLSEIDGTTCNDEVSSLKDYSNPTVITKSIASKASFTFTFSSKQVCFIAVVTYVDAAADVVANPQMTLNGNVLTMNCVTTGAKIYYTTDGSEPTTASTLYESPITLINPCSVRAKAFNGQNNEYSSDIVKSDYYISHPSALAVLGYNGGTVSGDVWTSTDGQYVLTNNVAGRGINYVNLAGSQDGFKLNHTDSYTMKISDNVKLTKIVVVGKSWLQGDAGNASTIAFDGFTPASGTFFDYVTGGETYVNTIEFTPSSELGYGATITMRPGNNQLGAYIEIYGEEYSKTITTTTFETTTWDFTNWSATTIAGVKDDTENWNQYEKDSNGGLNFGENGRSIAISRSNNSLSYKVNETSSPKIAETDGLKFTCDAFGLGLMFNLPSATVSSTEYTYHGNQYIWLYGNKTKIHIENVTKGSIIEIGVESHNGSEARTVSLNNATLTQGATSGDAAKAYQVCKWEITADGTVTITPSKGLHIYYIKLDKAVDSESVVFTPVYDKTTFVTPKALDFTNVSGLKAYVATAASAGKVTLSEVAEPVPAGTPLMLIGTANTEYSVPVAVSATAPATNMFRAGDGKTEFDGTSFDYILYSDGKFYQIGSGTVATTKAYLHCDTDPTASGSRTLALSFGNETTGISNVNANVKENSYYDLQGRSVAQPQKGLYIVNGKKVIIK